MDFHSWIEIAGLVGTVFGIFGTLFAFWQYRVFKRKGEWLRHFLLGLKACDLPTKAEKQVNDMLEWLKNRNFLPTCFFSSIRSRFFSAGFSPGSFS